MKAQMIRVISSPSSSTTGFSTLIFAIRGASYPEARRCYRGLIARGPDAALLLGERLAGTTHLLGEVLELGKAILHWQHGRLIVDVHPGLKRKRGDRRR